jgi:ABC-type phosphate transport system substrate-binding protein
MVMNMVKNFRFFLPELSAVISLFMNDKGGGSIEPHTVTKAGSISVKPLMEPLTAEYRKTHSNVSLDISAAGSGGGMKAVPAGTAKIVMFRRKLSAAEKGTSIDEQLIVIDGIAAIVSPGYIKKQLVFRPFPFNFPDTAAACWRFHHHSISTTVLYCHYAWFYQNPGTF